MPAEEKKHNDIPCYHCGEDCGSHPIVFDDRYFCCHGCKTVYNILSVNKLYTYYELEPTPGARKDNLVKDRYRILENPDIASRFTNFNEGGIARVSFFLPNIHCSSCIWLLENLQKLNAAILISKVNFQQKTVAITYKTNQLAMPLLADLLDSIGYPPNLSQTAEKQKNQWSKRLLMRTGIAGFCFGNIMLLSFPAYFSLTNEGYEHWFAYINMALTVPVFFYSALEFFSPAFKSLANKVINIDLPVSIGIVALFVRSVTDVLAYGGPGYFDSLAGLVFFLLIGRWYQQVSYKALSFQKMHVSFCPWE
ncbi:MAG: hypothetical protein HC896_16695 [Bacteroidales bacterium]|nr:hypothetical protein [Bacteroidales bacterium]